MRLNWLKFDNTNSENYYSKLCDNKGRTKNLMFLDLALSPIGKL